MRALRHNVPRTCGNSHSRRESHTQGGRVILRRGNRRGNRGAAGALIVALALMGCSSGEGEGPATQSASATLPSTAQQKNAAPSPSPSSTWEPTDVDVSTLTLVNSADAATVITGLVLDPHPDQPVTDERIKVLAPLPVYGAIAGTAVGYLDPLTVWTETTLPIFERSGDWGLVPVFARAGQPSQGVRGQATAWVYLLDERLEILASDYVVTLDGEVLTVRQSGEVIFTEEVGVGAEGTRTPVGRGALAGVWSDDAATYTEGHAIIATTRFSDDVDAFTPSGTAAGTHAPPLIAFHYHDVRSGEVSNGCIRVSVEATEVLASLPLGSPIIVRLSAGAGE